MTSSQPLLSLTIRNEGSRWLPQNPVIELHLQGKAVLQRLQVAQRDVSSERCPGPQGHPAQTYTEASGFFNPAPTHGLQAPSQTTDDFSGCRFLCPQLPCVLSHSCHGSDKCSPRVIRVAARWDSCHRSPKVSAFILHSSPHGAQQCSVSRQQPPSEGEEQTQGQKEFHYGDCRHGNENNSDD